MRLQFLGSGSAFTMTNFQSNILLAPDHRPGSQKLLIDCGTDIRFSLAKQGLNYKDINCVYISHLHADHVGGLEWLALCRRFDPECEKSTLFINESLVDDLWSGTLRGGLRTCQGLLATLSDFFYVQSIPKNQSFFWYSTIFNLIQTIHVVDGYSFMNSFGLLFDTPHSTVFITTDTQYCPNQIMDFYKMSTIIFQDCETYPFKSGVHAHYTELKELPYEIKKKMFLYHYNDTELPDAVEDGFGGFVKQGQIFDI